MMFFVFILTLLGMYLLFISTEKYRSPKSAGHFKPLAQKYYSLLRILAFLLFALSGFILIKNMVFQLVLSAGGSLQHPLPFYSYFGLTH